jgi:hypothetical protein
MRFVADLFRHATEWYPAISMKPGFQKRECWMTCRDSALLSYTLMGLSIILFLPSLVQTSVQATATRFLGGIYCMKIQNLGQESWHLPREVAMQSKCCSGFRRTRLGADNKQWHDIYTSSLYKLYMWSNNYLMRIHS